MMMPASNAILTLSKASSEPALTTAVVIAGSAFARSSSCDEQMGIKLLSILLHL
jgi:hypothetical protein